MKPITVRSICAVLSRKRLLRLADELSLHVDRRATAAELGDAMMAAATTQRELVERLTASEWSALCKACDVNKRDADRGRQRVAARAKVLEQQRDNKYTQSKAGRGRRPKGAETPDNKGPTMEAEASELRVATDRPVSPPTIVPSTEVVLAASQAELAALQRENLELRAERANAIEIAESMAERADTLEHLVGSAIVRATCLGPGAVIIEHEAIRDHALTQAIDQLRARAERAEQELDKPSPDQRRRRARARLLVIQSLPPKPVTRGDCINGPRPCPWTACEWHLARFQKPTTAAGQPRKRKHGDPEDLPPQRPRDTCVLDVTDRGEQTLEQVAGVLGITRERVRQIQANALTQAGRIDPRFRSELRDFLTSDNGINTAHIRVEQQ